MDKIAKIKIPKLKIQILGFTVIEMLVSVAILGLVVVSSTSIFFVVLKAKKKIKSAAAIKQSGSYALAVMTQTMRSAKKIISSSGSQITVVDYDGDQTIFNCDTTNKRITINEDVLVSTDGELASCSFNWDQTVEPNTVDISFTLTAGTPGSLDYASQEFKEKVSLRKY